LKFNIDPDLDQFISQFGPEFTVLKPPKLTWQQYGNQLNSWLANVNLDTVNRSEREDMKLLFVKFGGAVLDRYDQLMTKQRYDELRNYTGRQILELSENGNLDMLKELSRANVFPSERNIRYIAFAGQLNILEWLFGINPSLILDIDNANWAAFGNHVNILNWFEQHNILPSEDGANYAAEENSLDALKWLKERDIFPTTVGATDALVNGHIDVLNWLASQNPPIFPDTDTMTSLFENWRIERSVIGANRLMGIETSNLFALKWLSSEDPPIYPDIRGINNAIGNNHLDILKWLAEINPSLVLNTEVANIVADHCNMEMLQWLASQNIFPTSADGAAMAGCTDVLEWLAFQNPPILATSNGANDAFLNRYMDTVRWLLNQDPPIRPTSEGIDEMMDQDRLEDLIWLESIGIRPTVKGINLAAMSGHLDILKHFACSIPPILPDKKSIDIARAIGNMNVVRWWNTITTKNNRVSNIPSNNRVTVIPSNNRVTVIPSSNTINVVPSNNRVNVVRRNNNNQNSQPNNRVTVVRRNDKNSN
jgi:hypothetical protein